LAAPSSQLGEFSQRAAELRAAYEQLVTRPNTPVAGNGVFERFAHPVITPQHVPLEWRYDFSPQRNPYLLERIGVNATFNSGAIKHHDRIVLCVRVEGADRKSYFALAESSSGTEGFRFRESPLAIPDLDPAETNVYDMRLVAHEDGWIYGLFCSERHDELAPEDLSAAVAECGIIRSRDLENWERLPNLITPSRQQRNCVLHPEFVQGQYAFYTRPLSTFVSSNSRLGICWGLCENITRPVLDIEHPVALRDYHTIDESKNGLGPAPLKTSAGWLQLAHGVRQTAAGLRYVLYLFLTALEDPFRVIARPAGYFLAPEGEERVGDVSNVVFSNGWVALDSGDVLIYYGSSDTRLHVARSSISRLLDYVQQTPADGLRSHESVRRIRDLIAVNRQVP
jgi:4-O-beta-D-mannosyl-D-glucose phosphorylase